MLHAILYACTVSYLAVLKRLVAVGSATFRAHLAETYHGKVVRLDDARTILTINQDIEIRNLEQVVPYRYATDLILKNPHNIVVYDCPCRRQKHDHCQPVDVCLVIGDPFADLLRLFQPFHSRRITQEEALSILRAEDERGHLHTAWFKATMLNRFYAICNCCRCCCLGMQFMAEYGVAMIQPSGYRAVVSEQCTGCGNCATFCQFDALQVFQDGDVKRYRAEPEKCFGCGVCESKCRQQAIKLVLAPERGVPLDIKRLGGDCGQ